MQNPIDSKSNIFGRIGRVKDILRIQRNLTVPPEKRYRLLEPVATAELGEPFVVETVNFRTPIIHTPDDANPVEYKEREETGPIFINGIKAGDTLAIEILDIEPVGHASGGECNGSNSFLEISKGKVFFPGGLCSPLKMMIGDIYVTPPNGYDDVKTNPGDNGGNMDFKDIAVGNTLCLKAMTDGGLLVLGDIHAVQGDGEILGLAAECAGNVTLRVTKEENILSPRPLVKKENSFVCIACRLDYAEARDLAAQDAAKVLAKLKGCTEEEAYLYVTTVGDLRNGAIWSMGKIEPGWIKYVPQVVGLEVPIP